MIGDLLAGLGATPLAAALRASLYAYPLVNAAHILSLAALFGSILALDLRLLGVAKALPVQPLAVLLPRVAAGGLAMAVLTGALLFLVQPVDYAANRFFLAKIGLVAIGTAHAVLVRRSRGWQVVRSPLGIVTRGLRLSALASLLIWTAAIVCGRFIGFE
ncbi:DUF2214 domain-containing protein [Aurantimonas aggregata]|uniref:DUF2214 domain-containing protein n=1 Tax=Aurantimonas aggregata TaxID=2047720 RepID=A0A6L9MN90_9HYPH|nr:DUF6644 family protein [Aurantimonas aggregata]NDV88878.1 DUF2214 domain-containing protein [Aurantimonas aggregata]